MQKWKKLIFVNAIKIRVTLEGRLSEDIIKDYVKLTNEEKSEILSALAQA